MVMAVAKGNVAVITGAASGNGLAAAQHLARLGLRFCLADLGTARLDAARSQMLVFDPGIWWCIVFPCMEGCAMGQVLHGSATTTEAIRRAIQNSQESLRALSSRYGINQKTVAKWKNRTSVADVPTGPKDPKSTVLSIAEEAVIVAFRRHTLVPLDDCLSSLQPSIPHLSRSSLGKMIPRIIF